jgi:hypothetical protein
MLQEEEKTENNKHTVSVDSASVGVNSSNFMLAFSASFIK